MNIINTTDGLDYVFTWYDNICDLEKYYTDQELADALDEVRKFCTGNNPTYSFYLVHHSRSEELVKARAKQYCKNHHLKLEEYDGPLPYRMFLIDTLPMETHRRLKLERIIKKQKRNKFFNRIKSIWKYTHGEN